MAEKRVIEQTASSEIYNDDWFLKDSVSEGTSKISGVNLKELLGADGTQALEEIANAIAEEYDSTQTYAYNSWVFHEGVLYRCITQSVTGTWDATKWQAKTIKEFIADSENLITSRLRAMFGEYLPISTLDPPYVAPISKGDIFIYQQTNRYKFYRAKADHPQGVTEFDIDDWDEFDTVSDLIEDVTENAGKVADVQVKTTGDYETVVDNKVAKIDLSNKADKDGMYDELFAGNLVTDMHTADNTAYLYRQSPSASSVSQNIVGGTVAWNQLAQSATGTNTISGVTFTKNADNSYTLNGTGGTSAYMDIMVAVKVSVGHKMFIGGCPKNGSSNTYFAVDPYKGVATAADFGEGKIYNNTTENVKYRLYVTEGTTVSNLVFKPCIIDLTQMFGSTIADYIYSLEQATAGSGIAWLKSYGFLTKDYYAYNSGSLESVNVSARKVVGKNLLPTISQTFTNNGITWTLNADGSIALSGTATANSVYDFGRTENLILPAGSYFATENGNGYTSNIFRVIGGSASVYKNGGGAFSISESTSIFMRISIPSGTTINTTLYPQIELGSTATAYEPYETKSYPLDSDLTLRGIPKLDANNNLYYDGDTYESDGSVTRKYGVVDLGSLEWALSGASFLTPRAVNNMGRTENFMISNGKYEKTGTTQTSDDKIMWMGSNNFAIKDSSYTDATTFKTAMNGVYLVYELATPTSDSAIPYQNPQLVGSTEEFIDTRDVPIPVGGERKYYTDLKAKLEELAKIPDVPSTNGTYTLKATRSASGVAYNWISG